MEVMTVRKLSYPFQLLVVLLRFLILRELAINITELWDGPRKKKVKMWGVYSKCGEKKKVKTAGCKLNLKNKIKFVGEKVQLSF